MVQVRLRAQFDQAPAGKLAVQRLPEAFPVLKTRSLAGGDSWSGPVKIDQRENSGASAKMLYSKVQAAGTLEFDGGNPPGKISLLVPTLDDKRRRAFGNHKPVRSDRHKLIAGFDPYGLFAGFEKALNRQGRLTRTTARGLPGCGLQRFYYRGSESIDVAARQAIDFGQILRGELPAHRFHVGFELLGLGRAGDHARHDRPG
jgi:hypothetical protein